MLRTILKDTLLYEPSTGIVRHNPDRPRNTFKTESGYKTWLSLNAGRESGSLTSGGYLLTTVTILGEEYNQLNHRLAFYLSGFDIPADRYVDHIDGNRSNNRLNNLRIVTGQGNSRNTKLSSNSTSGHLGVCWHKSRSKWQASITVDRKAVYLGLYETIEEAISVRKAAEIKYGFHPNHGRE